MSSIGKTEFQLFCEWASQALPKRQLHGAVQTRLCHLLAQEFPDNAAVSEISAVKGGRNDLIHYWQDGKRAVFELFCSTSQVPQDLRLLEQADAHWKIAILLDKELRSDLADAYFRKKPESFPFLWLSQIMMPGKERESRAKLRTLLTMPPLHTDQPRPAVVQTAHAQDSIVAQTGHGDISINQKKIVRPQFVREPGDITEEQAFEIKRRIEDLAQIDEQAGRGSTYGKWQNYFKNTFHLTSYKKLPAEKYDEAIQFLNQIARPVRVLKTFPVRRKTDREENVKSFWDSQTPQSHHIVEFNNLKKLGVSRKDGSESMDYDQLPAVLLAAEFHQRYISAALKPAHNWGKTKLETEMATAYSRLYLERSKLFEPMWFISKVIFERVGLRL